MVTENAGPIKFGAHYAQMAFYINVNDSYIYME